MLLAFRRLQLCVCGIALLAAPLSLSGCNKKGDDSAVATDEGGDSEDTSDTTPKKRTPKSKKGGSGTQASTAPDVKRVDGIPYDVFFDRPLTVGGDKTPVGGSAAPATATPAATDVVKTDTPKMNDAPKADAPKPAAGGGDGWDKTISTEELLDAIKGVRNQLQTRLASVQAYNSAQLEVPVFGTELTVLADIARQHPGEIRWKDKAKIIRTLAIEITKVSSSAEARGKKSFDAINGYFLKACELLDGNAPPDLPESPDEVSLEENANIKYLMKRLDRVESTLKTGTASEDGFKKNLQVAQRESAVLAALAKVIQDKSYGYDSEDEYNKHANGMREAGRGMVKAAQDSNFSEYDMLRSAVSQRCSDCHMTYRTGK